MTYLADTHIIIWSWQDRNRLSNVHEKVLTSDQTVFASVASIWEIAIKASIGKLDTAENVEQTLLDTGYTILPIEPNHVEATRHLPLHHSDPFDRLLVAQAQLEGLILLSVGRRLERYGVKVV